MYCQLEVEVDHEPADDPVEDFRTAPIPKGWDWYSERYGSNIGLVCSDKCKQEVIKKA